MPQSQSSTRVLSPEAQALLLQVLPILQRIAAHYAIAYNWARRLEADDLAQIGAVACLEALARGLHVAGNPMGYLIVVGRRAIQRHCGMYQSLITTPRKASGYQPALPVLSLDAPLFADSEETLLDVLAL